MIWYKFYLGDYITHTTHLSDAEDLAYRRLIDLYMMSEKPIPTDTESVSRKIRLDRDIVESVLNEFFEKTEFGYTNLRCDVEIAKYQHQVKINRQLASKGGRPRKTESVSEPKPKVIPKQIQIQKQKKEKDISSTASTRFAEFWSAWPPSKRKVNRIGCEKKWLTGKLDLLADQILAHLTAIKQSPQWQEGFEPAPMTYLNQRRWEDEVPQTVIRRAK